MPEDKAQKAVETVVNYLKQKLPSPISSQIDNVISSGGGGGIAGKVGEMLK